MSRRILSCVVAAVAFGPIVVLSQAPPARPGSPPRVTFTETIAPIVYGNCVTCHRPGEAAPFSLISYEDVARRGALIAKVTESRYMPPWHAEPGFGEFVGERRLTDGQIATIAAWVKQGMPRGDEAKMPKLPESSPDGWRLGTPDLVLEMPAGFEVPASGPDVFRNFVIPTRLTEDKWVRGIEFRPSARKVVHHAIFASVAGGSLAARDGADGRPGFGGLSAVGVTGQSQSNGLGGWAVGATPRMLPPELTARLPKGSDFLLQMHFHPGGKVETEKSLVGIYFADKGPDKDLMSVELPALFGFGAGIDIPPGEKRFTIRDSYTLPGDARVLMAIAHAHYLARDMKAVATLPDGSTKGLLWISDWDFNWQDQYIYKQPLTLPKGTRIDVTLVYDNSAENPRNPINPPRRALFGEYSSDEMGTVGFTFEVVNKPDLRSFEQTLGERTKLAIQAAGKDGTLGRFLARGARQRRGLQQLTLFDRQGSVVSRVADAGAYSQAALSPDGSRVVAVKSDADTDGQDLWVFDVATGRGTPITSDAPQDDAPIWSPDGRQIAYVSVRDNTRAIYRKASNGSGAEELVYRNTTGGTLNLTDWSADGRYLCFWSGESIFLLPLAGERAPIPLDQERLGRGGRFSPDGRLLAFSANPAGRFQIYVKDLTGVTSPASAASVPERLQVSSDGGIGGIFWRRDGRELYYLSQPPEQTIMAVEVSSTSPLRFGAPRALFKVPSPVGAPAQLSSIASADGQRFVFAMNVTPAPAIAPPAAQAPPATAAGNAAVPRNPQARLDPQIVNDLFKGLGGDVPALRRGLEASAKRLAEAPNDAEVLAWHGAAMLSLNRLGGDPTADFAASVKTFQVATGEMNQAIKQEPDNPLVRMARGVLLYIETPYMPRFANHPGLVENARADYQRLFDLKKDQLQGLGTHRLGEILQGLGDLNSRQDKPDQAETYYTMIQSMLPGTEYAARASEWMKTKKPLPTERTTCIGCHETK
jgi:Tol biopolymer transport system component/mono/diheme cytochrome c family protein